MTQKKLINQKQKILEAAQESFAKFGYKKTTLDDIGLAIGLNKASIYYYFKSKEELFSSVILDEFEQFISTLHKTIVSGDNCKSKIVSYFIEKLRYWTTNETILPQIRNIEQQTLNKIMESGMKTFAEIEAREKSFIENMLTDCIKNKHIRNCDESKVSSLLFGIADGIKDRYIGLNRLRKLAEEEHNNMLEDIKMALSIFIDGLSAALSTDRFELGVDS